MNGEIVTPGQCYDARSSLGVIHILVVDDDPTCLAIVAGMLRTWKYNVLAVKHPIDALATLRMNQGLIDLVVTDVHMPDMNGFELQKHVDEEFKLPVVMMSADDRENVILKGLELGAAFFMVKPISADDLKNIWQYVIARKKGKSSALVVEETGSVKGSPPAMKKPYHEDIGSASLVNEVNEEERKKRKEYKRKTPKKANETKGNDNVVSKTARKPKVIWTTSLHNRFLYAINRIGLDKSVPKRIVEFMNVPGLTRENVASHLQKYRIFLRRVADTSDEAARNLCERILLRSSFAPSYSSLIFNSYQQNYPQFSEQQQIKRVCQPGFGLKNGHGKLLSCSNQEASKSNSITRFKCGKSHSSLNKIQANFQPQNHLYQAKFSSFGLTRANSNRIGDVSSGDISGCSSNPTAYGTNGLITSTNGMQVYQNQAQRSSGVMTNIGTNGLKTSTKGSSSGNFTTNGLGSQNYISGIENIGSYNGIQSNFNNLMYPDNDKYADTQMTNYGGNFSGFGDQMGGYLGESSNYCGGDYFYNVVDQQESAMVQPPPPLQDGQDGDGTDSGNLFGSIENSSTFNRNSLPPFTEGTLGEIFLQQINDQSSNQQGDEEVLKPDFSNNSYHVEAPQEIVQPLDQPEGGEEVISTQQLSDNMYLADSILSWFDPQPNQAGGEEMVDPLFNIDAYDLTG